MKRKAGMLLFFGLTLLMTSPCFAKPNASPYSAFIKTQREAFQSSYARRQDKELAREFGYGTGIYVGNNNVEVPFEWYASCGVDGYIQFQFNIVVSYEHRSTIMLRTDETSDKRWIATSEDDQTTFGIDNKWTSCDRKKKDCSFTAVLNEYVEKFAQFPFFKDLKTSTYY